MTSSSSSASSGSDVAKTCRALATELSGLLGKKLPPRQHPGLAEMTGVRETRRDVLALMSDSGEPAFRHRQRVKAVPARPERPHLSPTSCRRFSETIAIKTKTTRLRMALRA